MSHTPATRILIVDDNPSIADGSRHILEPAGYTIDVAYTGQDGLRIAQQTAPDIILLDRDLPDLEGIEVCRMIKEDEQLKNTLVVFASASRAGVDEQVLGLNAGGDGYITRPISNAEFRARVDAYVRIATLNRHLRELQQRDAARLQEIEEANQQLARVNKASINLMEDAVLARKRSEEAIYALRASEERYRNIVDAQDDCICRWLPDTTLTFVNANYQSLFGIVPEDLYLRKWIDFLPETDAHSARENIARLTATSSAQTYEHKAILADGSIRHFLWTDTPIFDASGACVEYQSIGRDITDLRANEEEAAKRLNAMEHSPASVVITNRDGLIEYVNPKFTLATGYTSEEVKGQNPRILKSGETPSSAYKAMWDTLLAGHDWRGEFHNRKKDGTLFWEMASISPLRNKQNEITHFVAVKEDITERKLTELRLEYFAKRALILLSLPVEAENRTEHDYLHFLSEQVRKISGSSRSFVFLLQRSQGATQLVTWVRSHTAHGASVLVERILPADDAGLWTQILQTKKPVTLNEPVAPETLHDESVTQDLHRLAAVSVLDGGEVRLIVAIAGHTTDYREIDVETLQLLANDAWRVLQHRRAERALKQSEELLAETGEAGGVGGWEVNLISGEIRWTRQTRRIHEIEDDNYNPSLEQGIHFYAPEARPVIAKAVEVARTTGKPWDLELPMVTAKGRNIWIRTIGQARFENGQAVKLLGAFQDVTERRLAEQEKLNLNRQLAQAQKMESIGLLAGGIAHEFNNKLQAILGYSELALRNVPPGTDLHVDLREIQQAARQSAELTKQLLGYASKQMIEPRTLDPQQALKVMLRVIRQLLGENIDLQYLPDPNLWSVRMDPNQLDQVITNLCVNARDALSGRGRITIRLTNAFFNENDETIPADGRPGPYLCIAVTDNGPGIPSAIIDSIFDPFFTTKPLGKGTGLGLPTVLGIIRQNHGFIRVESREGEGATFEVYLPRVLAPADDAPDQSTSSLAEGTENILLVEDEPAILKMTKTSLTSLGYNVVIAPGGQQAIDLLQHTQFKPDLLVTDVVMPGLSGLELYTILKKQHPGLSVLYMSGHAYELLGQEGVLVEEINFLAKPFTLPLLAEKVRWVLENASGNKHSSPPATQQAD